MFGMNSKKNVLIIKNKVDKLQSLVNSMNRTKYFWTVQIKVDKFLTHTDNMSLKNHHSTNKSRIIRKIVQVIVLRRCNMEQIGGDHL
jgi:hypothetical protein